jgi:hypothetical protein
VLETKTASPENTLSLNHGELPYFKAARAATFFISPVAGAAYLPIRPYTWSIAPVPNDDPSSAIS